MNNSIEEKDDIKRRDFLRKFLVGGFVGFTAVTVYPVISFLKPPKQTEVEVSSVVACKNSELATGDSKIIRFGNKPVLVIKYSENNIGAFSATCTHLDCTVQFKKDEGIIWCACHNGKYDLHGKNIAGPPPRPLDKFNVQIKNDDIIVSKET